MANGRRYRGRLNVLRDAEGLTVTNRVLVESYLAGVIGGELGPRRADERQAMLAQAVVSRTFALKNRGRWEPQGFDAWADVRDQVYTGIAGETADVWGALRATRGEVLRYNGDLIYAYFHSTCGFSTAVIAERHSRAPRASPTCGLSRTRPGAATTIVSSLRGSAGARNGTARSCALYCRGRFPR